MYHLSFLLFVVLLGSAHVAHAQDRLQVGYFVLPPYAINHELESGRGSAIDYFELLARDMNYAPEWQQFPFLRLLGSLEEGTIDVALVLAKNPERERTLTYPEKPFAQMQSGLALNKDNSLQRIASINDVLPLSIGVLERGYLGPFMRDKRINWTLLPARQNPYSILIGMLHGGRFDAVYNPSLNTLIYGSQEMGIYDKLKFLELPEPLVNAYSVFRRDMPKQILEAYNRSNDIALKKDTHDALLGNYILSPQ